jgi:hypothetical protein
MGRARAPLSDFLIRGVLQPILLCMMNPESDAKLELVKKQTADLNRIMIDNMNKAFTRGESLELLEKKSNDLVDQSKLFESRSVKLRRFFCMKNAKMTICIVLIVLTVVGILVAIVYASK